MTKMKPGATGMALVSLLALGGCGGGVSNDSKLALQQLQAQVAGAEDVAASVQALSLHHGLTAVAAQAAAASGVNEFLGPSTSPSASPAPTLAVPAGTPPVTGVTTTVAIASGGLSTNLVYEVALGDAGSYAAGTDKITATFSGLVTTPGDTQASLQELHDRSKFALTGIRHELALGDSQGARKADIACSNGAFLICASSMAGSELQLSLQTQIEGATGKESGSGNIVLQASARRRHIIYVRNPDGSGTETVVDPIGLTATITVAADGSLSGVVGTETSHQAITAGAAGTLATSGGAEYRLY